MGILSGGARQTQTHRTFYRSRDAARAPPPARPAGLRSAAGGTLMAEGDVPEPLLTFLLPGLDGTGRLFSRFVAAATGALELRVLPYPPDRFLDYEALEARVREALPPSRPFALLGESFGGPLALRIAGNAPPNLVAVVLVTTFHRRPVAPHVAALRPLAPAFFRLPVPAHGVRLVLAGTDAPDELVRETMAIAGEVPGWLLAARAREALRVDESAALRRCPVPILFVGGERDWLLRREIPGEIRALRPDAQVTLLDAPHLLLQRLPAVAMAIIEPFLLGTVRQAAPGGHDGAAK